MPGPASDRAAIAIVQTPTPPPSDPPPRPDAAAHTLRRERRWLPTLAVASIILGVVLGGYVTAAALSSPEGEARTVAGAVTVTPAGGWLFVGDLSGASVEGIRFTRGSGTFDVLVAAAPGDATAVAEAYVRESLEPHAERLQVSPDLQAVPLAGGLAGVRFSYIGVFDQSGVPIEGEVTAVATPAGAGVIFDGWAPQGQLRFALDDVRAMVEEAAFP